MHISQGLVLPGGIQGAGRIFEEMVGKRLSSRAAIDHKPVIAEPGPGYDSVFSDGDYGSADCSVPHAEHKKRDNRERCGEAGASET